MTLSDPLTVFVHDHGHLAVLVVELREALERARLGHRTPAAAHADVAERLERLREDLFLHFAREEEALFPYVLAKLPQFHGTVAGILAAHDGICGALSRMTHLARRGSGELAGQLPAILALFARFESAYGRHAGEEASLLRSLGDRLSAGERMELAELVRGL